MNDSGFWVVQRLSGFTEKETLRTWSVLLDCYCSTGIGADTSFSKILPLKGNYRGQGEGFLGDPSTLSLSSPKLKV